MVKSVDGLSVQNINLFVKQIKGWNDEGGIDIVFNVSHMVKVKVDDYVIPHRSKENISQEKNVIQTILDYVVNVG